MIDLLTACCTGPVVPFVIMLLHCIFRLWPKRPVFVKEGTHSSIQWVCPLGLPQAEISGSAFLLQTLLWWNGGTLVAYGLFHKHRVYFPHCHNTCLVQVLPVHSGQAIKPHFDCNSWLKTHVVLVFEYVILFMFSLRDLLRILKTTHFQDLFSCVYIGTPPSGQRWTLHVSSPITMERRCWLN